MQTLHLAPERQPRRHPTTQFFTCQMPFLPHNQQCQSTEGIFFEITHTHAHPFNGPLSGTTQVSLYQKGKTNLDFTGARDSEWQWHQLGHPQVCTSLQRDNHTSTPPLSFSFTVWMPFLPPNQQCQSTEGIFFEITHTHTHTRLMALCPGLPG